MSRSKLKKRLLTTFLAVAMTFTSINVGPFGAVTAYAEGTAKLAAGDYYILNTATGRLLNGGNSWGSQASALRYGQLITLSVVDANAGTYYIDSHISNSDEKHFVNVDNGSAFMDGLATPLTIAECGNGSYTIANADGGYLTASNDNTIVTYLSKSELSEWRFLTREELIEEAEKNATEENPVDVTSLILDSGFGRNNTYVDRWNDSPAKGGENTDFCAEKYRVAFDSFQTIENVPNGLYELSLQGFYREDEGSQGPAKYYMNETEKDLMKIEADAKSEKVEGSWSTQRGDVYVPNTMTDSSNCFIAGAYKNDAITVLVKDHTLKIGVKTTDSHNWVIWDNFTLKLKDAMTDDELAAYPVRLEIDQIGEVSLDPACKEKIDAARAAYDALTDAQKACVTNYATLQAAEAEYDRLFAEGGQEALDQAAANVVIDKITAIGTVELSDACKAKIDEARTAYNALTDSQKALVTNYNILETAEAEYKSLKDAADQAAAAAVTDKITAIGEVAFTTESRLAIKGARTAYDALTEDQKALVTQAQLQVLTDAEAKYAQLAEAGTNLADGDYYLINVSTGKYLNAGNSYQTQASIKSYGQLMTFAANESDNTSYTIDTHYLKDNKHYLGANGYLDAAETPIKIEKCASGNFSIANADDKFLTAPTDGESTVVTFAAEKSEASEWLILTRDQLIKKLTKDIAEGNPADVTSLILNPNFDRYNQYSDQWSGGIKIEGAAGNYCAEVYGKVFDSMQTLENVPNGVYELSVQGFYRKEKDTAAPAIYYINGTEAELKTIEADGRSEKVEGSWSTQRGDVFVPNSMTDSSNCFSEGAYTNDFITVTVTDHTLKIGVKTTDANSWVIWDNFILRLKEVTEEEVTDAEVAASVVAKINAIGTVALTEECDTKIKAARAAYDDLTDAQKALVTAEQLKVLTDAEAEYARLLAEGGQEAIDREAAKNAVEKINAIGTVALTEECDKKIKAARTAYDALTAAQKALVTAAQLKVLTDAEEKYNDLKTIADVIELIDSIGEVTLAPSCKAKIEEARKAYDALTEVQKALVTAVQLKVLTDAEEKYNELRTIADVIELIDDIGEVTLAPSCKAKIDKARAAYDALTADQKTSVTNYNALDEAEKEYAKLLNEGGQEAVDQAAAKEVLDKIDAIGTVEATEECKVKINDAWMLYNALTDVQKALITAEQLKVLTDAEAKFVELMGDQMPSEELKKELAEAVENANAEALVEEAYTKESWQVYKEALDTLHTLSQQVITTKPEIETALKALQEASDGLKVAEGYEPTEDQKTSLTSSVDNAVSLDAGKYEKDENWAAFQKALARAQEIKNRPNATAAQVEKAMKDLEEAIANLKPIQGNKTVDKTALKKAVDDYGKLKSSNYTSTTWKPFKKALDAAKNVLKNDKATQKEVDNALNTLNAKKKALKKVTKVKSIKITADYTSVAVGKKAKLKTTVKPSNATNKAVKWSVAAKDKKYVSVSSKGVVSTKKAGAGKTVTVTATAKDGSKKKATIKIKIMKNAVTKITLKAKTKKVKAGKKVTVKATVITNGKKANKKLAWKSSNKKYATVNAKGVVTTKKAGKGKNVTITATSTDGTNKKGTIKIKIVK